MKIIIGSKGENILVNDEDYVWLSKHKWYLSNGYAINERRKKMHRLIMEANPGEIIDHVDRNKINNQRSNLRFANKCQNVHNQKKRDNTKTIYKGVHYVKRLNSFVARCRMNFQDHFLGYYRSDIAAAYAYNKKAKELSEFSLLNDLPFTEDYLEDLLKIDRTFTKSAEKTSDIKGIHWHKSKNKWEASSYVNGKRKYVGAFDNEQDAAIALYKFKKAI